MILSFHPCFDADTNIIVAGRDPGPEELAEIQSASAVILPQGCRESLYRMAIENCAHVFPDYSHRFAYPGKTGQATLFKKLNVPFPNTLIYKDLEDFSCQQSSDNETLPIPFPFVFKFDWGGEGQTVYLINSRKALADKLYQAAEFEKAGLAGFILQAYIPHGRRSLRVAVINQRLISYWRIQPGRHSFGTSVAAGASIEHDADEDLQQIGREATLAMCTQTGINLAGVDIIFDASAPGPAPLFLEINYFFGRSGLGGSEAFYQLLIPEIETWLATCKD